MPVSVRSSFRTFIQSPSDTTLPRVILSEKQICINTIYMMLGVKTDFFIIHNYDGGQKDSSPTITIHASVINKIECIHLSSGAIKSTLARFAQVGTVFSKLRRLHELARFKQSENAVFQERLALKHCTSIQKILQDELSNCNSTLLALFCKIKPLFLEAKSVISIICTLDENSEELYIRARQLTFLIGEKITEKDIALDYAQFCSSETVVSSDGWPIQKQETESKCPIVESKVVECPPPSFFVYYIREGRIVAS